MKPWAQDQIKAALASGNALKAPEAGKIQRTAHGPARSRCSACGAILPSGAAQTRHFRETGHLRYELILE